MGVQDDSVVCRLVGYLFLCSSWVRIQQCHGNILRLVGVEGGFQGQRASLASRCCTRACRGGNSHAGGLWVPCENTQNKVIVKLGLGSSEQWGHRPKFAR